MKTWPEIQIIIKMDNEHEKTKKDDECDDFGKELCEAEKRHGQTDSSDEPDDERDSGTGESDKSFN